MKNMIKKTLVGEGLGNDLPLNQDQESVVRINYLSLKVTINKNINER